MMTIDFSAQMAPLAFGLIATLVVSGVGIVSCVDPRERRLLVANVRRAFDHVTALLSWTALARNHRLAVGRHA